MLTNFTVFYRKAGIRLPSQLNAPVFQPIESFYLPLNSVYHHIDYDGLSLGPVPSDLGLAQQTKAISILNVHDLTQFNGNPRKQIIQLTQIEQSIIKANRRLRLVKNLDATLRDPATLVTINYNLLFKSYLYTKAVFTPYMRWSNAFATVVSRIADLVKISDREHFLFAATPEAMPSVSELNMADDQITNALVAKFSKPNTALLLELWKFTGKNQSSSLLASIPRNKRHLVNLVYLESGKFVVLNLGYLDSFIKNALDGVKIDPTSSDYAVIQNKDKYSPIDIQKRLLVFMLRVMDAGNVNAQEVQELVTEQVDTEEGDIEKKELDLPQPSDVSEYASVQDIEQGEGQALTPEQKAKALAAENKEIDELLSQLDDIVMRKSVDVNNDNVITMEEIKQAKLPAPEEAIIALCDKQEVSGTMSAAEYKRIVKLASAYKTIKNPFGEGTLETAHVVTPEDLSLAETPLVDGATVHDKTMLRDSLTEFDRKYVERVLNKHVASMALSVQRAGYCLTDFTAEPKGDVMGTFRDIRMTVVPIEGKQSTLPIKFPDVDKNGVVRSNDINYRWRKLRVDDPIRKISPERVALTSYYGKTFVYRGRRKANDYGEWVRNQVMVKGFSDNDPILRKVFPTESFDNEFKAPRAFTMLAMGFSEIITNEWIITFDKKLRDERGLNTNVKSPTSLARRGFIKIGVSVDEKNKDFLLMDKEGAIFTGTEESKQPVMIGSMEELLGLDISRSPIEHAEVSIMGKDIPVGILLSYYMGFTNLLKALGAQPRSVEAGRRLHLEPHEYAIEFSDETLIFSKSDTLTMLIVGGFAQYYKACRRYSRGSFDKSAVYLNIFEANKITTRYLREIILIEQMFVDPITLEELRELKEPETFQGLLIRATELLLTDYHKDPLDFTEQRLRGYERFAGAIYTELIRSIRQHQGAPGKATKKLEMNPYAVHKRIFEDSAKAQVVEINPIQDLREVEGVTFAGEGGRSKDSMNADSRKFHPNDQGIISENTSDSSDVGINTYLVAAPMLASLKGKKAGEYEQDKHGATSVLSTAALLAPGSDGDDCFEC